MIETNSCPAHFKIVRPSLFGWYSFHEFPDVFLVKRRSLRDGSDRLGTESPAQLQECHPKDVAIVRAVKRRYRSHWLSKFREYCESCVRRGCNHCNPQSGFVHGVQTARLFAGGVGNFHLCPRNCRNLPENIRYRLRLVHLNGL